MERALHSVARWRGDCIPEAAIPEFSGGFPFPDVLAAYRLTGRLAADSALVAELRRIRESTGDPALRAWLKLTTDQEDGDYAGYVGTELFAHLVPGSAGVAGTPYPAAGSPDADAGPDAVTAALLADLVALEAQALVATAAADAP
ncbi:MAG: hypothetical protein HOY69_03625, partial [Streptomyces sp.]|nr:hypothetical protein [Streptomyces sp.]